MLLDSHWSVPGRYLIHAGGHHAGILIVIKATICHRDHLAFDVLHPGRLLHVRLHLRQMCIDVLGVYQYAWSPELGRATNVSRREEVWEALNATIERLPNRNQLVLCGDFNTDLQPCGKLVGPSTHPTHWNSEGLHRLHKDQFRFQDMISHHKLVALNSWGHTFDHTFTGNFNAKSRIDFILTKHRDCDSEARRCRPLPDCPLMHLKSGPQHHPIVGTIPQYTPHHRYKPSNGITFAQRHQMYTHYLHHTTQWHNFQEQAHHMATTTPLSELNTKLHTLCTEHFQYQPSQQSKPWNHPQFIHHHNNMWQLHKQFSNLQSTTLPSLFQAWQQITKFQRQLKQARQASKHHKKQQLYTALHLAANYAYHKDTYNWFKHLTPLKRKSKQPTIQIRDSTGHITDPPTECQTITHYLKNLYTDINFQHIPPPSITQLPFTQEELHHSLSAISGRTAGPAHLAPNLAWKAAASAITPHLYTTLLYQWTQLPYITIPQEWITSWIILLPKPNKSPDKPENLRPISLLHPISKAITKLLALKARAHSFGTLSEMPQYAYLPMRSTSDALHRAFTHCRTVRTLTTMTKPSTLKRYLQPDENPPFQGGFQLSLDMTKAFDNVPRQTLINCLQQLSIPDNIKYPLIAFLAPSTCTVTHKQSQNTFTATRGLRQGSTDAPFAWSVLMWSICKQLATIKSPEWVPKHLTIYADDILAHWVFHTHAEYLQARKDIQQLFTVLEDHGMMVNTTKSAFLLKTSGKQAHLVQKHITKTSLGPMYHIQSKHRHIQLPLKNKHEYLGSIISYGAFEKYTYLKRQTQAKTLFEQLKPILRDSNHHSIAQRLKLYDSSVKTCLLYGILISGLTPSTSQQFHALLMQHYKYIAKSPRHITKETNHDLLYFAFRKKSRLDNSTLPIKRGKPIRTFTNNKPLTMTLYNKQNHYPKQDPLLLART